MKRIRVLHISPDSIIYGTERHILSILKYSDQKEFEHYVATPERGSFNAELEMIKVKSFIAGRKPGYNSKFEDIFNKDSIKLYKLIKQEKFDIVHTHLNTFGGFIGKLAGAPVVIHTRHGIFWTETELNSISFLNKYFQKMKSNFFDVTIAIGEYEKKL